MKTVWQASDEKRKKKLTVKDMVAILLNTTLSMHSLFFLIPTLTSLLHWNLLHLDKYHNSLFFITAFSLLEPLIAVHSCNMS